MKFSRSTLLCATAIVSSLATTKGLIFGRPKAHITTQAKSANTSLFSTAAATTTETPASPWEDLQEKLSESSSSEPVLTFYRDTNGWCPFCERVWVCIRAKNLPYQERLIPLFNKPEWYKEMVPTTQVPAVLFHPPSDPTNEPNARKLVWESLDIMKTLDDVFPDTPRLVLDTEEYKAASEQCTKLNTAGFGYVYASRTKADLTEDEIHEKKNDFLEALDDLEQLLVSNGGPFILGESFTGVDAEIVPSLERWRYQLPLTKQLSILDGRPALTKWFESMEEFTPYSDRVAGDEYSWTAAAAMFARFFGGGDEDPEVLATIERSDAYAKELVNTFQEAGETDGTCEERFVMEAARKIISNHEAIVKDCTNADPKSQQSIGRSTNEENANQMLLHVVKMLFMGEDAVEGAKTCELWEMDDDQQKDAALAAKTVASRLSVPRDMSAPAAKILRAVLMITADRLVSA